ncbi:hypothetical protein PO909_015086 [Leuciscus waleckii]
MAPPWASEPWTPPQPVNPSSPAWLHAPSAPPWSVIPQALSCSLIPLVPRTSGPLATPRLSTLRLHQALLPSGFTVVLTPTGSALVCLVQQDCSSTLALHSIGVTQGLRPLGFTWVSTSPGSIQSIGFLASPSIGCAMGLHPNDSALGGTLSPPFIGSTLVSPSARCSSVSWPTSKNPILSPLLD